MVIRRAPASMLFSRSSFTTETGRSMTSPAAIWPIVASSRIAMRPMAIPPLGGSIAGSARRVKQGLGG